MDSSDCLEIVRWISSILLYHQTGSHNLPISRLSHVHFISFNTCHPVLRRKAKQMQTPVTSLLVSGFIKSERLPTFTCVTTLNRIHLMLRPASHLNHFHGLCHRASCHSVTQAHACLVSGRTGNCPGRYVSICWTCVSTPLLSLVYIHLFAWLRIIETISQLNKAPRGTPDIPHLIKYICFSYDFSLKSMRCVIIRRRYLKSDAIFTEN